MPAWEPHLSESERWALVRYLKEFSERFADEVPERPMDIPPAPEESPELVEEGQLVYAVLRCWQCHGMQGRGDGPSANDLKDDWGRGIKAYDFTYGDYKNGASPSDFYRTLVTGLNGTPMPAFEPTVVTFAADDVDPAVLERPLGEEGLRALQLYLDGQPTASELQAKSVTEIEGLGEQRLWALVYYVRSLERSRGPLHWLFSDRPEPASGVRRRQ
jgi:mono/diheme cytochrome c family protein